MNKYIYALRDLKTKKLINAKAKGGKYYLRKIDAMKKCDKRFKDTAEVVEFELIETKAKQKGLVYLYTVRDINKKEIDLNKVDGDKFYNIERYVDKILNEVKYNSKEKVIYELKENKVIRN